MKNIIAYYYNLYSYDIHQYKDVYKFSLDNSNYSLVPCNIIELKKINEISSLFIQNGIYIHQIVLTSFNNIYITYNNKNYVLLKYPPELERKIELDDILKFHRSVEILNVNKQEKLDWGILWGNKIDYFEYQISQLGKRYPKIRESFSYYIGIVETGIALYNNTDYKLVDSVTISHKRIGKNSTLYDLYNPINLIVDNKTRDMAEYFKNSFIEEEKNFQNIIKYFFEAGLSIYDCYKFFIRMFYPSFYFDLYEQIIQNEINENKLNEVIDKSESYELLLKQLYQYLSNYIDIPDIEWLKKT